MTLRHVDATNVPERLVTTRGTSVRSVPILLKAEAAPGTVKWTLAHSRSLTHTHTRSHTLPLMLTHTHSHAHIDTDTLVHTLKHTHSHCHTYTRGGRATTTVPLGDPSGPRALQVQMPLGGGHCRCAGSASGSRVGTTRVGTTVWGQPCDCCVSLAREEGPAWPGPLERPSRCRRLFAVAEAEGPLRLQ